MSRSMLTTVAALAGAAGIAAGVAVPIQIDGPLPLPITHDGELEVALPEDGIVLSLSEGGTLIALPPEPVMGFGPDTVDSKTKYADASIPAGVVVTAILQPPGGCIAELRDGDGQRGLILRANGSGLNGGQTVLDAPVLSDGSLFLRVQSQYSQSWDCSGARWFGYRR